MQISKCGELKVGTTTESPATPKLPVETPVLRFNEEKASVLCYDENNCQKILL